MSFKTRRPLELSNNNDFVGEFALCDAQADFFLLSFDEASELQVFVSADERLEIVYHLLGSDNQTIVASGFVGELGAELLTTTVAEPSTRILQVIPLNETEGFYSLILPQRLLKPVKRSENPARTIHLNWPLRSGQMSWVITAPRPHLRNRPPLTVHSIVLICAREISIITPSMCRRTPRVD